MKCEQIHAMSGTDLQYFGMSIESSRQAAPAPKLPNLFSNESHNHHTAAFCSFKANNREIWTTNSNDFPFSMAAAKEKRLRQNIFTMRVKHVDISTCRSHTVCGTKCGDNKISVIQFFFIFLFSLFFPVCLFVCTVHSVTRGPINFFEELKYYTQSWDSIRLMNWSADFYLNNLWHIKVKCAANSKLIAFWAHTLCMPAFEALGSVALITCAPLSTYQLCIILCI